MYLNNILIFIRMVEELIQAVWSVGNPCQAQAISLPWKVQIPENTDRVLRTDNLREQSSYGLCQGLWSLRMVCSGKLDRHASILGVCQLLPLIHL